MTNGDPLPSFGGGEPTPTHRAGSRDPFGRLDWTSHQ